MIDDWTKLQARLVDDPPSTIYEFLEECCALLAIEDHGSELKRRLQKDLDMITNLTALLAKCWSRDFRRA